MPSPIGHALGGIAAGWFIQPAGERGASGRQRGLTLGFAALGMAADLDLLLGVHRGPSHSIGATLVIGLVAWAALRHRRFAGRLAAAIAAAYGSHVVLDWLGADSSPPLGLLALWPVSDAFYQAPWPVFPAISRRIHQPHLFWVPNIRALALELLILVPAVSMVAYSRRVRSRAL